MPSCPECGESLPADAEFCANCGASVGSSCPNCGRSVEADAKFCPGCGENLRDTSKRQAESGADAGDALRLQSHEFARRIGGSDLQGDGLLDRLRGKQEIEIEAGNRALLLEHGEVTAEIGPGKHTLDTLGQRLTDLRRKREYSAILVETGDTPITMGLDDLRTAGDVLVGADVEFVVAIDDPELLFTGLMADRDVVTAATFDEVLGDAVADEIQATVADQRLDDLYGTRTLKRDLQQDVEHQLRSTLERYGLALVALRSLTFDDDRQDVREERTQLEKRRATEELKDEELELDKQARERESEHEIHETREQTRVESAEQAADHEVEKQAVEQDHEIDDMERRHEHRAEREDVEHEQETATTRKEGEVQRRDLEHEQDMNEMEDLVDLKRKKDEQKLDKEEREQEMEMHKEEHEAEVEKERLDARDDVDASTLASMDETSDAIDEIAKMEAAEDLDADQLDSLGARESDELAKARQEANKAEKERQRVEDQKEFREEMKDVVEDSMDRMQETTESAMDNMGDTGKAAAEDTSDNVIVSDSGASDSGDTTIVQGGGDGGGGNGGGDGGGGSGGDDNAGADSTDGPTAACPECGSDVQPDDAFCMECGTEL
ncbi:MAG: zinc-ribbon domain-containing protein [Haloarculaceae archaeon]